MFSRDVGRLPVVDPADNSRVVGYLGRAAIWRRACACITRNITGRKVEPSPSRRVIASDVVRGQTLYPNSP